MKKIFYYISTMFACLLFFFPVYGQVDISADFVSRYVWRGMQFGESPSIQPGISYTTGGFEFGVWGAFATTGDPDGTEVDLWAAYTLETSSGSFTLSATDYTFPNHHLGGGAADSWFDKNEHFIEMGLAYSGPESFPVSLSAGVFVHNDDDNSVYFEIGYDTGPLNLFIGFTPAASAQYGTTGAGVINAGFGTTRSLRISDSFSPEVSASFIVNPYAEHVFFVFGIGL